MMSDSYGASVPDRALVNQAPAGLASSGFDPSRWAREFAVDIAVAVSELPDRTSPDDWPEDMLVTASELSAIIEARILPELENAFDSGREEGAMEREALSAFGASEAACYFYPGEDEQRERAAFCAGAAYRDSAGPKDIDTPPSSDPTP